MKKSDFNKYVNEMREYIKTCEVEDLSEQFSRFSEYSMPCFVYARWCESNFEANLRKDYKRKTTFTNDFSISEWFVGIEGIKSIGTTLYNALTSWRENVEFFAELILVLNKKSWEHSVRGNVKYSRMYAALYNSVRNLYFEWYDEGHPKHEEAMQYYYDYVD